MKKPLFSRWIENIDAYIEAVVQRCSVKKMLLEISQNSQENTCDRGFFQNKVAGRNFIKNEPLAQELSFNFCEMFNNTFFTEQLWTTASVYGT